MPANLSKCLPFRDTLAAPGSELHAALEARDMKRTEAIYRQCEQDNEKLRERYARVPGSE